jgi:hypothetical protein
MNLAHTGTLGKLARASDLRKDGTRQSDNLSGRAALALQSVRLLIVENPKDASLRQLVDSFRRALQDYDAGIDKDPAAAAMAFGEEIDRLIQGLRFTELLDRPCKKACPRTNFGTGKAWRSLLLQSRLVGHARFASTKIARGLSLLARAASRIAGLRLSLVCAVIVSEGTGSIMLRLRARLNWWPGRLSWRNWRRWPPSRMRRSSIILRF